MSTFSETFKVEVKWPRNKSTRLKSDKASFQERHGFISVNKITESCPNGCFRWSEATDINSLGHSDSVHIFFNVHSLSALTLFLDCSELFKLHNSTARRNFPKLAIEMYVPFSVQTRFAAKDPLWSIFSEFHLLVSTYTYWYITSSIRSQPLTIS